METAHMLMEWSFVFAPLFCALAVMLAAVVVLLLCVIFGVKLIRWALATDLTSFLRNGKENGEPGVMAMTDREVWAREQQELRERNLL